MTNPTNQSRVLDNYPEGTEQSRTVGMFLRSSDLNTIEEEHPHVGMASNPKGTRAHRLAMKHAKKKK